MGFRRRGFALVTFIGAAVAVGVGLNAMEVTSPTEPPPNASVTSVGEPTPPGYREFAAPGITFTYPGDWVDLTHIAAQRPHTESTRIVAVLAGGKPRCFMLELPGATAPPSADCYDSGALPGSIGLQIFERFNYVPGEVPPGEPTTIASRPAWLIGERIDWTWWVVEGHDGGYYTVTVNPGVPWAGDRRAEVDALLESLVISDWTRPLPEIIAGRIRYEVLGFSLAVPADWAFYRYAWAPPSSAGVSVVVIASNPLEPCGRPYTCHLENPAEGLAIGIDNVGCPVGCPDWDADANQTVGGQAAIHRRSTDRHGVERHSWAIRPPAGAPGSGVFWISATLRGPDVDELRRQLVDVIASIVPPSTP